ncbi:creatininase family protein [uncultured Ruthenibacterium sp.]|uniref:creatininase family protein n=1 Tax=uncultured Ruthenibacterium sp. TaxID=1905347 RepID=UPI00349E5976
MRTVQLEHMRPEEIVEQQKKKSIAYLPLGPLEWHTLALPYGTDPMIGHFLACRVAEKIGGVVLPPLFLGSDCPRPKEQLERLGFHDTNQYIVGMDFPKNTTKSFYLPPEIVSLVLREYVRILVDMNFRMIILVNCHGAATQAKLVQELCAEFTNKSKTLVIDGMQEIFTAQADPNTSIMGHANISEASLMQYISHEDVDYSTFPSQGKIRYEDYAIVDRCVLFGNVQSDGYVVNDPRNSSRELGQKLMEGWVEKLSEKINTLYSNVM